MAITVLYSCKWHDIAYPGHFKTSLLPLSCRPDLAVMPGTLATVLDHESGARSKERGEMAGSNQGP